MDGGHSDGDYGGTHGDMALQSPWREGRGIVCRPVPGEQQQKYLEVLQQMATGS